mgnify:FL=1
MKELRIFLILVVWSIVQDQCNAQELLMPKNNAEFMCAPVELISDFDKPVQPFLTDNEFLTGGQQPLAVKAHVSDQGIGSSQCLTLLVAEAAEETGPYFLKCDKVVLLHQKEGVGGWCNSSRDIPIQVYFRDNNGKIFYIPKKMIEGRGGWSYFYALPDSYRIPVMNDAVSPDNKRKNVPISYPCQFLGIGFQQRERNTVVSLDEIAKVRELDKSRSPGFSISHRTLANVYSLNDQVIVNIAAVADVLSIQVRNYKGEIIKEETGGEEMTMQLPTGTRGYFELFMLSYQDEINERQLVNGKVFSYSVVGDETVYNSRLGVCTHPQRSYYSRECTDLMAIIGAKYMRFGMVLEFLENGNGNYSLNRNTLDILNDARDKDLRSICIFRDKVPPLTDTLTNRFLDFSRFLLNEYPNSIEKIELWNEWSNGTGTHPPYKHQQTAENYTKFLRSVYPVLKAEYPSIEMIGLGGENPQRFKEHILDMYHAGAGPYMDAISLHPYRQPVSPASRISKVHAMTMAEQVEDIVDISLNMGGPGKVYVTEIGYSGHLLNWGMTDYLQAVNLVKTLGLLLSTNVVEQVDWYNLYDMNELGVNNMKPEEYAQYHFGLFNGEKHGFAVKPAAMAFRFFASITAGLEEGEHHDNGEGFFELTFKGNNGKVLTIAWDEYHQSSVRPDPQAKVFDMMGNPVKYNRSLILGREPVYILR